MTRLKKMSMAIAGIAALVVAAGTAQAVTITPGGSALLSDSGIDFFSSATEIAEKTVSFSAATFQGTLESEVYQESGGTLDFVYLVTLDTCANCTDAVERVSVSKFTGVTADVGFTTNPGDEVFTGAASDAPVSADRSGSFNGGKTIGFNFTNGLMPGDNSYLFYVRTNATTYYDGLAALQDSVNTLAGSYAPVPEPSTLLLLGSGLLGLGLFRRKKA